MIVIPWKLPGGLAKTVSIVIVALGLWGCAATNTGPKSISAGRAVYSEVINRTQDEQLLNAVVRMRYDETFGMLSVASVTASLRFRAELGAQAGIGSSDNYANNLVPFSAGLAYEESPTISYLPLEGDDFMRSMLSPVSTDEWVLVAGQARRSPGLVMQLAAVRVNDLRNPLLGDEPPSKQFNRFITLYNELRHLGVMDVVRGVQGETDSIHWWAIHDYAANHAGKVRELLDLVGVDIVPDGSPIYLPLREAVVSSRTAIHVETRSPYDVLRVVGAGIEIPQKHLDAGIVEPVMWPNLDRAQFLVIHSSESPPELATVKIRFRDSWFYIDATDSHSKRAFSFLRTFIGIRLSGLKADRRGPVLTVPVK